MAYIWGFIFIISFMWLSVLLRFSIDFFSFIIVFFSFRIFVWFFFVVLFLYKTSHFIYSLFSWFFLLVYVYCISLSSFEIIIFLTFIHYWKIETEHEQGRGRKRGRHRIQSRLQALSCQHRARHRAWTHKPWDHDLSWSRTLNRLSPQLVFLLPSV